MYNLHKDILKGASHAK